MNTSDTYTNQIEQLKAEERFRQLRTVMPLADGYCRVNGERVLNLSSNDYLGLAGDADIKNEFLSHYPQAAEWPGFGAGSSRLLIGNTHEYNEVEDLLANLYHKPSALFFNSGYHANLGILPALTGKDDLILSDKLVHASLIDGIRLSTATHIRYRHLDYAQLETLLKAKRHLYRKVFVVTESVFSMDGDLADLGVLAGIKEKYDALLYVDEAHAVGVRGKCGLGLAEEQGVMNHVDLLVGTMGKALASVGAYVITSAVIRDILINQSRPFIFSTALPPVNMAWSKFVLAHIPTMDQQRNTLTSLSEKLTAEFNLFGIHIKPMSNIIPVLVGENRQTVELAGHLLKQGFLVMPIRPPTVPVGTSRLRLSLTSGIHWNDIQPIPGMIHRFMTAQNQ